MIDVFYSEKTATINNISMKYVIRAKHNKDLPLLVPTLKKRVFSNLTKSTNNLLILQVTYKVSNVYLKFKKSLKKFKTALFLVDVDC